MNFNEKQLSSEYIYKGKIINLRKDKVELPDGNTSIREVIEHPGGVCVVPLTENNEIIMVKQFRYPYNETVLEIPAGKRDKPVEPPLETGKRELKEETGATAENYYYLGELYPTPGYCGEVIYMYAATGLSYGELCLDEGEFLSCERIPLQKAVDMILKGEIKDSKTQAAVLKLHILKSNGVI